MDRPTVRNSIDSNGQCETETLCTILVISSLSRHLRMRFFSATGGETTINYKEQTSNAQISCVCFFSPTENVINRFSVILHVPVCLDIKNNVYVALNYVLRYGCGFEHVFNYAEAAESIAFRLHISTVSRQML